MDLMKWFSSSSPHAMIYQMECCKFWTIGKQLFHGKFLKFMRGPYFKGESNDSECHRLISSDAKINFPVPSKVQDSDTKIMKEVFAGLMEGIVGAYVESGTHSNSLQCMWGLEKINICAFSPNGGVNLSGFEASPSAEESKSRLQEELFMVDTCISKVETLDNSLFRCNVLRGSKQ